MPISWAHFGPKEASARTKGILCLNTANAGTNMKLIILSGPSRHILLAPLGAPWALPDRPWSCLKTDFILDPAFNLTFVAFGTPKRTPKIYRNGVTVIKCFCVFAFCCFGCLFGVPKAHRGKGTAVLKAPSGRLLGLYQGFCFGLAGCRASRI